MDTLNLSAENRGKRTKSQLWSQAATVALCLESFREQLSEKGYKIMRTEEMRSRNLRIVVQHPIFIGEPGVKKAKFPKNYPYNSHHCY